MVDYDGRRFRSSAAETAAGDGRTPIGHYHQRGDVVWAEFSGGAVVRGSLVASCAQDGTLTAAYCQVLADGEVVAGSCTTTPEVLPDGRLRLREQWRRHDAAGSTGVSYIEELAPSTTDEPHFDREGAIHVMRVIDGAGSYTPPPPGEPNHWVEQLVASDLSLGTYSIPAGGVDDQRPHLEDEVYVVQSGEATIETDSGSARVRAGSVVFVPANEGHRYVDVTEDLTLNRHRRAAVQVAGDELMTTDDRRRLLLVGSGSEAFRAYALSSIAQRASVVLLTADPPTWELPYLQAAEVVDFEDERAVLEAARRLRPDGVLTYDERYVELTPRLALELGLPYAEPEATSICKDKLRLRRVLHERGLSPVRFGVAHDLDEAIRVAGEVGYPLVLKPRALAGSAGVVRVDDQDALEAAFAEADDAHIGTIRSSYAGVLIEECLEGPEYSVDCLTIGGRTTPVVLAEKVVGLPPYYEEVRHFVPPRPADGLDEALELVAKVLDAAGLDHVGTHTEFRLTPAGPRIIEVNVRMGGDLIPYLGLLASGVDLPAAAADVALGRVPDLTPRRDVAAAIHFFYPEDDLVVGGVGLDRPVEDLAGVERFVTLVGAGDTLLLPPLGFISRLALAVVTGDDREQAEQRLDDVVDGFVCEGSPVRAAEGVHG